MTNKLSTISAKAIWAAKHRTLWGASAARRFASNNGVPVALYRLACQLEAAK